VLYADLSDFDDFAGYFYIVGCRKSMNESQMDFRPPCGGGQRALGW